MVVSEKPDTWVTDSGQTYRCIKGFFSQSAFSAESPAVSVQPLCAITCMNICVYIKNPIHWQPYRCLHTQILHTLVGLGSVALAAVVALTR